MCAKWVYFLIQITGICVLFLWLDPSFVSQAESVSSAETKGTIGFYGIYESENKPQPSPPDGGTPTQPSEGIDKPIGGRLPQLGQWMTQKWIWIGFLFIGIILFKKRQTKLEVT